MRTKFVARRVGVAPLELVAVGEADAMDEKVERAPVRRERANNCIDRGDVLDVAGQHASRAEALGERRDPFAERFALIGESEFGALAGQRFGDAPGDRMIVGDAHHEAALAAHQSRRHQTLETGDRWISKKAPLGLSVDVFENERRVGAAEAEGIGENGPQADIVAPRLRTIGMSANAGSISSICALSQMKPFCIISSE